MRKGQIK